jgi:hypothetical protein
MAHYWAREFRTPHGLSLRACVAGRHDARLLPCAQPRQRLDR